MKRLLRWCWVAALIGLPAPGCGDDKTTPVPGAACTKNTDCESPLVCSAGRCRQECEGDRDCPQMARCLVTSGGNVCRLPDDKECNYNSDCGDPKLVCAIDRQCRSQCQANVDCPKPQSCVLPDKVCVSPSELTADGKLPSRPGSGSEAGSGGQSGEGGGATVGGSAGAGGSGGDRSSSGGATGEGARTGEEEGGSGGSEASAGSSSGGADAGSGGFGAQSGAGGDGGAGGADPGACVPGNTALHFGSGQYVVIPDRPALHPSDLTLELWANFGTYGSPMALVAKPFGSASGSSFGIWFSGGMLRAGVHVSSDADALALAWTPVFGRWYQLALTYSRATGKQSLYIDGELAVSGNATGAPEYDSHPVYIGATNANGAMTAGFVGDIDEVALFSEALSEQRIQADRAALLKENTDAAAAYWALDDYRSNSVDDASQNDNRGRLGDTDVAEATDPTWIASTVPWDGVYETPAGGLCGAGECNKSPNGALHFLGSFLGGAPPLGCMSSLTAPDPVALRLSDFTLEVWANWAHANDGAGSLYSAAFVEKALQSSFNRSFSFAYLASNQTLSGTITANGVANEISVTWRPTPGVWYHLAFSYAHDTGAQKLYVNDDLVASKTLATPAAPDYDTGSLLVGLGVHGGNVKGFSGALDELRIWNRARSLGEISADQRSCPAPSTGLAGYWSFDEGSGQVAADATANGTNLQLGSTGSADACDPTWIASSVPF